MINVIYQITNINILFTRNIMAKYPSSSQNVLVFPCPLIILLRILFDILFGIIILINQLLPSF